MLVFFATLKIKVFFSKIYIRGKYFRLQVSIYLKKLDTTIFQGTKFYYNTYVTEMWEELSENSVPEIVGPTGYCQLLLYFDRSFYAA